MAKYFWRLFIAILVSSLGIGGGAGLLVFIIFLAGKGDQHAGQYGLVAGIFIGLISAAVFLCVMMPLDLLFRLSIARSTKTNETAAILENEQVRELKLRGPVKQVHFACRQALLSLPGVKNVHDDTANSKITASTGTSWRCPGEVIEVTVKKLDAEEFLLCCVSRPAIDKVVFDHGKNFENVELWKKRTQEFMNVGGAFGQFQ